MLVVYFTRTGIGSYRQRRLVVATPTNEIAGCGLQLARMGQRQLNAVEPERNIAKTCAKRKRVFLPWLKPEVSNAEAL